MLIMMTLVMSAPVSHIASPIDYRERIECMNVLGKPIRFWYSLDRQCRHTLNMETYFRSEFQKIKSFCGESYSKNGFELYKDLADTILLKLRRRHSRVCQQDLEKQFGFDLTSLFAAIFHRFFGNLIEVTFDTSLRLHPPNLESLIITNVSPHLFVRCVEKVSNEAQLLIQCDIISREYTCHELKDLFTRLLFDNEINAIDLNCPVIPR